MREFTLLGFAGVLTHLAQGLPGARHAALERGAVILEAEAKRVIGTYDYGWPSLAEATQAQRVALGFSANEPGLRSGEMRESIGHTVLTHEAVVGSNNDKLVWFELGTEKQPARPVLMGAAKHKGDEIAREVGRAVHGYLSNGGKAIDRF